MGHDKDYDDRRADHWHLKKEVPIATILTILTAITVFSIWLGTLRRDIDLHYQVLQQHITTENKRVNQHRDSDRELLYELKAIRKDITLIKLALARSGLESK